MQAPRVKSLVIPDMQKIPQECLNKAYSWAEMPYNEGRNLSKTKIWAERQ